MNTQTRSARGGTAASKSRGSTKSGEQRKTSVPSGTSAGTSVRKTSVPARLPRSEGGRGAPVASSKFREFRRGMKSGSPSALFRESDPQKDSDESVHPRILKQARQTGQLNLSGRGLTAVPSKVWAINEPDEENHQRGFSMDKVEEEEAWWEQVDLTKLILASNQLTKISEEIQRLESLTTLDIHDNALESLPPEIGKLDNLQKLNVNHNKLRCFPKEISDLRNLKTLLAAHNEIRELTEGISRLDMLDQLDLAHNQLESLPSDVGYLTRVTDFNVSNNRLKTVPDEISFMRSLKILELSHNELSFIPEESLKNLHHLEQIYLRNNKLKTFPSFQNCNNLKEIHLGYNSIDELTVDENIPLSVVLLDLKDNKLKILPDEIIDLQNLERLDISTNLLSSLPYTLGTMPHLKALIVEGNGFKALRRDIINRGTVGLLEYLRSRIDEGKLAELREKGRISPSAGGMSPPSPPIPDKYSMKNSSSLSITGKEISELPKEAVDNAIEAGVSTVDLSKNSFTHIPEILAPLIPQLFELNMSGNQLSGDLPDFLSSRKFNFLNFSCNKLTDFRPFKADLTYNLVEINLSYNRLQNIPECLYECPKLETILLTGNRVREIHVPGLAKLTRLAVLDLSNNNISVVPPELGTLTQIRSLRIEGNAFRVPRPAIVAKGTASIMAYLRDRLPQ